MKLQVFKKRNLHVKLVRHCSVVIYIVSAIVPVCLPARTLFATSSEELPFRACRGEMIPIMTVQSEEIMTRTMSLNAKSIILLRRGVLQARPVSSEFAALQSSCCPSPLAAQPDAVSIPHANASLELIRLSPMQEFLKHQFLTQVGSEELQRATIVD